MEEIATIDEYNVFRLEKNVALKHIEAITQLANSIPLVNYTKADILAEKKAERIFHEKWKHSFIVFDREKPIAIIIGYEREKENNNQYPENSIYISELAVDKNYQKQGVAHKLIEIFINFNKSFSNLNGDLIFTVQTNSAAWNNHVIELYKNFGFEEFTTKEYDNRTDVILRLKPGL